VALQNLAVESANKIAKLLIIIPYDQPRGVVVSASASLVVGLEFGSRPGLTKTL